VPVSAAAVRSGGWLPALLHRATAGLPRPARRPLSPRCGPAPRWHRIARASASSLRRSAAGPCPQGADRCGQRLVRQSSRPDRGRGADDREGRRPGADQSRQSSQAYRRCDDGRDQQRAPASAQWLTQHANPPQSFASGRSAFAGVPSSSAFVATLAYRLFAYWLPVLAGGPAYLMFRHRYGAAWRRPPAHQPGR
jgi:hypothetical protein